MAAFKFFNAGQTCIAPNFLYVHKEIKNDFLKKLTEKMKEIYGENAKESVNYSRVINERFCKRN